MDSHLSSTKTKADKTAKLVKRLLIENNQADEINSLKINNAIKASLQDNNAVLETRFG